MFADHLYLNLNVVNNDNSGSKPYPNLQFSETRNSPILMSCQDYYLSVIRFTIESATLPVFIPSVKTGQNDDPNILQYQISMRYNHQGYNLYVSNPVLFVPQNLSVPVPAIGDNQSEYYFLNTIQPFINMVNTCFQKTFNELRTLCQNNGIMLPNDDAPYLEWDSSTGKASLNAELLNFEESQAKPITIFFNSPLYVLFNSFDCEFLGFNRPNNDNYRIRVKNTGNISNKTPAGNISGAITAYVVLESEYSNLQLMNPVQSIVFTTSTLPIVATMSSNPVPYNSDTNGHNGGNNSLIEPILTDMTVGLEVGYEYKNTITYNPSSQYRLIDLYSNSPLSSIKINAFWRDQYSNLFPIKLASGCSANMKILFIRKSFYRK